MKQYVCSVCGYVYNEAAGVLEKGIAAGTKWADLPEHWVCPLCGAAKSAFQVQGEPANQPVAPAPNSATQSPAMETFAADGAMSAIEMSAICTNLARGCEKQYKADEAALFAQLAAYCKAAAPVADAADFDALARCTEKDLEEGFPLANAAASGDSDRGAKRALVWSEKVTRMQQSLLARYQAEGDAMLEHVFVCTICGFVYIGRDLPEVCPVCKVPNWKFERVEGGQSHG